jgi:hypothetical protein
MTYFLRVLNGSVWASRLPFGSTVISKHLAKIKCTTINLIFNVFFKLCFLYENAPYPSSNLPAPHILFRSLITLCVYTSFDPCYTPDLCIVRSFIRPFDRINKNRKTKIIDSNRDTHTNKNRQANWYIYLDLNKTYMYLKTELCQDVTLPEQ